jgi:hypothetical protein
MEILEGLKNQVAYSEFGSKNQPRHSLSAVRPALNHKLHVCEPFTAAILSWCQNVRILIVGALLLYFHPQ